METEKWIDGRADGMGHAFDANGNRYSVPRELEEGVEHGDRIQFVVRPRKWQGRRWVDKLLLRP